MALSLLLPCCALGGEPCVDAKGARWHVLMAVAADGRGAEDLLRQVEAAAAGAADPSIRLTALVGQNQVGALFGHGPWTGHKLFCLAPGEARVVRDYTTDTVPEGMGGGEGIRRLLLDSPGASEASHVLLLTMGHGHGMRGVNTHESDWIEFAALRNAIDQGLPRRASDAKRCDLLVLQNCAASCIEGLRELQHVTDWVIAAEGLTWTNSIAWGEVLRGLARTRAPDGRAAARLVMANYTVGATVMPPCGSAGERTSLFCLPRMAAVERRLRDLSQAVAASIESGEMTASQVLEAVKRAHAPMCNMLLTSVLPHHVVTCGCGSPGCCMRDLDAVLEGLARVGPERVGRSVADARAAIQCMTCDQMPIGAAEEVARGLSGIGAFLPCDNTVWSACLEHDACRPDSLSVLRGLLPPPGRQACWDALRARTRVVDKPEVVRREPPASGWTMRLTAEIAGLDRPPRAVWLDVTLLDAPAGNRPTHRVPLPASEFAPGPAAPASRVRVSWDCSLPFVGEGGTRIPLACVRHEELSAGSFVCAADVLYGYGPDAEKNSAPVAAYFRWAPGDPEGSTLLGLGSFGTSGQGLLVFPLKQGSQLFADPAWGGWWWGAAPAPRLTAGSLPARVRWSPIHDRRVRILIGVTAADGSSFVPDDESAGAVVSIPK